MTQENNATRLLKKLPRVALAVACGIFVAAVSLSSAQAELKIPSLVYRTGPYAPNGIPFANGYADYFAMLNARDGGIEGAKVNLVECETAYNTQQGVECYEKLKDGALVFQPLSTGITYQLIPKATADGIPVHSMGYGRTSAANGKIFPFIFNFPGTYWDAASIIVKHIGDLEGGMDKLNGKKVALVYHNSAYGKEPIRTLEKLAEKHGYELQLYAVDHPGQEQKSTWTSIRRKRPDYVMMWGWGVMNQVAIKEASAIRYPMEKFIGVWWSASENDVLPAGDGAHGYKAIAFHGAGDGYPIFKDIYKYVYDADKGAGDRGRVGEVLYNRGLVAAMWATEAIRGAMKANNTKNPTSQMVRDSFEKLNVDERRLSQLGLPDFTVPVKVTCTNHGGPGFGWIQQWDANVKKWKQVSETIEADRPVVDALIMKDSSEYAKEQNISMRDC